MDSWERSYEGRVDHYYQRCADFIKPLDLEPNSIDEYTALAEAYKRLVGDDYWDKVFGICLWKKGYNPRESMRDYVARVEAMRARVAALPSEAELTLESRHRRVTSSYVGEAQ